MDYFTSRFIFLNLFRTLFWTLLGLIRSIVTLEVCLSSAFRALDSIERFTSGAMLRLSVLTFWVASSWASLDDVPRRKRERARDPKLFGGTVRLSCVDETWWKTMKSIEQSGTTKWGKLWSKLMLPMWPQAFNMVRMAPTPKNRLNSVRRSQLNHLKCPM